MKNTNSLSLLKQQDNDLQYLNEPPYAHSDNSFPFRSADFGNLSEALDYAALAKTGMNFYNARGECEYALNYATIRHRSIELAKKLLGLGLSRGERVGIIAEMHPDFLYAFFACQYAGMFAVPLPVVSGLGGSDGYENQLKIILENSDASIALGPVSSLGHLTRAADGTNVEIITSVAALADSPSSKEILQPLGNAEVSHIQFSSGSTRHPLGIEINQSAVMTNAHSISSDALQFTNRDRVASWLPFYHDMGLVGCMIVPMTCQLTVDYLYTDAFARRPTQWLRMISDHRCSVSFSPTFGYDVCSRRMKGKIEEKLDLSCWRVAGIGGDMIQSTVMEKFCETLADFNFKPTSFMPSYGLAEATLAFSFQALDVGVTVDYVDKKALHDESLAIAQNLVEGQKPDTTVIRPIASCGKPMPGYKMSIRNERGEDIPERHVGSVFIQAPSLMNGYHHNKKATDDCMSDDGWLDTGDMGYVADGILYITGRRKDMIIINGRNIWPQDMEWHAEKNIEVLRPRDTAAFASMNADGDEEAVILVQSRSAEAEFRAQLQKDVRTAIFRNTGVECRVVLIPPKSLPFTTSGKLSRTKAKALWLQGVYQEKMDEAIKAANMASGALDTLGIAR